MPDVALIMTRNKADVAKTTEVDPNISLYYLKGALERQGISTEVINPFSTSEYQMEDILYRTVASQPKAIGISAPSRCGEDVFELSEALKERLDVPIVVGGYISILGREIIQNIPDVDVLFKGEGEIRAPELFRALIEGTSYEHIPGIIYRKEYSLFDTGKAPQVPKKVLGEVLPDFSYLGLMDGDKTAEIYSARGCYNACSFCAIRAMNGKGVRAMPKKSLQNLIESIAQQYQPKVLHFSDDNFLFKRKRLDDIREVVMKYGMKVKFQARAEDVIRYSKEIIRNKDIINLVSIGVESFSESQLRRWKKNTSAWENMQAINILSEHKIPVRPYFMFVDSETTHEELKENFRTFLRLPLFDGKTPYHVLGLTRDFRMPLNPLSDRYGYANLPDHLMRFYRLIRETNSRLKLAESYFEIFAKGNDTNIEDQKASITTLIKSSVALYLTAIWGAHPEIGVGHCGIEEHEKLRDNVIEFERKIEQDNMSDVAKFAITLEER
ncbi:radical SAM protein, partial [Candidatus Woesearchaeota archaeon]|nr:radical SAM protein [Candidatus Woesearchaeota archaeon]